MIGAGVSDKAIAGRRREMKKPSFSEEWCMARRSRALRRDILLPRPSALALRSTNTVMATTALSSFGENLNHKDHIYEGNIHMLNSVSKNREIFLRVLVPSLVANCQEVKAETEAGDWEGLGPRRRARPKRAATTELGRAS
jgi:hypothetical protein